VKQPTKPAPSALLQLGVDIGPLAVFFIANLVTGGPKIMRVLVATGAFMVAIIVAMIVSRVRIGRISPMLWMSGALVVVFGGLTLWFHDETFIKVKPTIVYAMFATILTFGLVTGRPLLKSMLEATYPGLTAEGWRKLTINWALFFTVMAVLNEAVWRTQTWDFWVGFKLWGVTPMTVLFALGNVPMLMKHGLTAETRAPVPPEG
jgi:intracellular septation protein